MAVRWSVCVAVTAAIAAWATVAVAQRTQPSVMITSPRPNSAVGVQTSVQGTATLDTGQYLWVLARRTDFTPMWWPQREAVVDPRNHAWSAAATLGVPQDVGRDFEIGVIVVDAVGHAALKDYWMKAMQSGDWKPIPPPKTSVPPQIIKVKRTR